jgi:7-carboxy-7-deazaguanine synthase
MYHSCSFFFECLNSESKTSCNEYFKKYFAKNQHFCGYYSFLSMPKSHTYKVKEIYYTIQGEGYHTGRAAVFVRFSGCNLWTGLEKDRDKAICKFCDTDFWGIDGSNGGKYTAQALSEKIIALWPIDSTVSPFVVITGGEPALQLDDLLVTVLHQHQISIAIETNGTLTLPSDIDWICVSPKANTDIIVTQGHELKLVYPQKENHPSHFAHLDFDHFYIQPLDDIDQQTNILSCIQFVQKHPQWKLSLQTHKILGID